MQINVNGEVREVSAPPDMPIPIMHIGGLAHVAGVPMEKFKLNMMMAGGSFGRRAPPSSVPAFELLSIINALKTDRPVKLMHSREDDMGSTSSYLT